MSEDKIDWNYFRDKVHEANIQWWRDLETGEPIDRNECELAALIVSELAEALEGERKGLMDDHLPHRKMAEVEMVDAAIRALDYAGGFKWFLDHEEKYGKIVPKNAGEAIYLLMGEAIDIPHEDSNHLVQFLYGIVNYCMSRKYEFWGAFYEKMKYNSKRLDHTHAARKLENGKKF